MNAAPAEDRLIAGLARLLSLGTWASCTLIAIGMVLPGTPLVTVGLVLLVALPTSSVAAMAFWFLSARERDLALAAALVVVIIVVSTFLGTAAAETVA